MHITDAEKLFEHSLRVVMDGYKYGMNSVVKWGRLMALKDMLFRYCVFVTCA